VDGQNDAALLRDFDPENVGIGPFLAPENLKSSSLPFRNTCQK
jgi:hypothetical protein